MPRRPAGDRLACHLQPPTPRERAARAAATASPAPIGRCYGYARVSTAMQADEGESLDVQQRHHRRLRPDARPDGRQGVRRARRLGIQAARRPAAGRRAARRAASRATW